MPRARSPDCERPQLSGKAGIAAMNAIKTAKELMGPGTLMRLTWPSLPCVNCMAKSQARRFTRRTGRPWSRSLGTKALCWLSRPASRQRHSGFQNPET